MTSSDNRLPYDLPSESGSLLGIRDFRLLCMTQLATGLRMPMLFFTQSWYVVEAAPDDRRVFLLGLLAALRGAVFLLYIVFGGAFADRYPRKTTLLVSHTLAVTGVVITGCLLLLPGAANGEGAWLWVMLVLFSGFGLINAQDLPTRSAMIDEIVPPSRVTSAVTIFQLCLAVTIMLGALLAGWTIGHLGFGASYLIAGFPHLIVMAILGRMSIGDSAADPGASMESVLANIRSGINHLIGNPAVLWIVLLTWIAITAGISVMGMLIAAWVRDILFLGASGWGLMMVFWGVGAVSVSSILVSRGEYGHRGLLFLGCTLTFGLAILGFSLSRDLLPAFLFNGLAGASFQLNGILGIAVVQTEISSRLHGRVMSLLMLAQGISQISALAMGVLGQMIGLELLFLMAGVTIVLITMLTAAMQKPLRSLN